MHKYNRCLTAASLLLTIAIVGPGRAEHGKKNTCILFLFDRYCFALEITPTYGVGTSKTTRVVSYFDYIHIVHPPSLYVVAFARRTYIT